MSGLDLIARALGYERVRTPSAIAPSAPDAFKASGPRMPYVWPAWRAGQPDWTPATLQGYAEAGYEGNTLVLSCVRRRSQSAAFAPLVAYSGERATPQRLPDAHQLARLLRRPNPHQSWYQFMQQGITYLDLDGNLFIYMAGVWRQVGRAGGGTLEQHYFPEALYLLRSDRVRVVPGKERGQPLLGYVYDPEDSGQWLSREPFLPEEVIHVKYPNPRDPFEGFGRGTSPLGAAAKHVDVDNAATSFLKTFFDQGVVPYGLLKSKQTLTDGEVQRIRQRLHDQYGGQQNWAETMVLDADADYQQMGMSFRDMTFDALDMRNEARICEALDVPPIIVGAKVGLDKATYANYQEARAAFWQDMLIPGLYQPLEDAFNAGLGSEGATGAENLWVAYDYSDVPALREDESQKTENAVRLFLGGVAKRNEARGMVKLEPVEIDGFRAADKQQIGAPAITQTPATVLADGNEDLAGEAEGVDAAEAGLDDNDDDVDSGRQANGQGGSASAKQSPFGRKASTPSLADGALKTRLQIERKWTPKIARALQKQLRLALPKSTTVQNVWEAVGRLEDGKQAVSDTIYQMMREAATLGLQVADAQVDAGMHQKAIGIEIDWTLVNSEVLERLKTYLFDLVSRLNDNSREALRKAIARWVDNGLPLQDLIDELTPMFGPVRAEMIASTEVTRAFAMANMQYWQASGVVDQVSWRTANDERVCSRCSALGGIVYNDDGSVPDTIENQEEHAVTVAIGQPFVHPGGPGKQGAHAGEMYEMPPAHVRCILPGNEVVVPGPLSAAAKSFYVGRCVEIRLANGRLISVTENHPILTPQGWVAAQFIREGGDVIDATDPEGIAAAINPDNDHRPAKIEEVFSALVEVGEVITARVPVAAEDFHGDGRSIHGDVDVVYVNRFLQGDGKSAPAELLGKVEFGCDGVRQCALFGRGARDLLGVRDGAAARGGVRLGEQLLSLLGRGVGPANEHRVGDVAGLDAGFVQALAKGPAVDAGFVGETLLGLAGQVARQQRAEVGNLDASTRSGSAFLGRACLVDAAIDECSAQGLFMDPALAREFCHTFAGHVAPAKVCEVRYFDFAGHVYDLQADMYELYICNGVIVKNCRCWLVPEV